MTTEEKKEILDFLNSWKNQGNVTDFIEFKFTDVSENSLSASIPVTPKVHQPFGILNGGISCLMAEILGSCLSNINIDTSKFYAVGTNLTANHLKSVSKGNITGTASFIRKGNSLHVSEIKILDDAGNLINHTVMTNNIIAR